MSMRYPGGLIASTPVTANYPSGVWTQAQAAPYQAQNVWTRDQFWPYTTLLLQGDGAVNGAQNNTFLDSSSNNFTITRNGNTTQGAFTPYEQDGYWSNYFDGNGDYLTAPNNTALDLSTGDFTVECWFYVTSVAVARPLFGRNNGNIATPSDLQYGMYLQAGGSVVVRPYQGGTDYTTVVGTAVINAWNHVALVRTGNTFYGFLNGVRGSTSQTISGALNTGSWLTYIGGGLSSGLGNDWMLGYISNVRIVKGTALYTSSFTPSAAPLTAVTNTSLLTCQSNRFRDNSTNNFAITSFGDTSVQAFQPFPGATTWSASVLDGSAYFDGSGDYLTLPVNSAFDLGLNACCLEAWVYLTNTNEMALFSTSSNVSGQTRPNFYVRSNQIQADFFGNAFLQANVTVPLNSWNHVAFTRASSSGPWRIFLNGVLQAYNATGSQNLLQTGAAQDVNRLYGGTTGQGYMCDLRIVNGSVPSAYVTSSTTIGATIFTPPTTPLTAITNTSLLLSYTNAGIYDNSMMNNLETVGNAQVSTSVVKYGTGSMAFDGSGDYLLVPSRATTSLEGDFTIELWAYRNATNNFRAWCIGDSFTASGMELYVSGSNPGSWTVWGNNASQIVAATATRGVWTHLALVRSGSIMRMYVDGVQRGATWTYSSTFSGNVYVAAELYNGTLTTDTNGYIDDFRITKAARYITNFTPPPARMPGQ